MADGSEGTGDALLDALAERLAPRVAEAVVAKLRTQPGFGKPLYATAKNNPCGSKKVFLRACRENAFPNEKRGRELSAEWAAVEEWLKRKSRAASVPDADENVAASAPSADAQFDALKDRVTRRNG
jgi:hypothetical protein